jgi:hypothetical protein
MSEAEDPQQDEAEVPEFVGASSRPKFAELAEEPAYAHPPRDYASDFGNGVRTPPSADELTIQPTVSPLSNPVDEPERDLDVPAFMRRLKF